MLQIRFVALLSLLFFVLVPVCQAVAAELVVYSSRKEQLLKPLFDAYTKETGTEISFVTGKIDALLKQLKEEGRESPADLLLTSDAGNLWHASMQGLLQPIRSKVLVKNIPEHLYDPQRRWFGLSLRARTIVYSTERVNRNDLSTYEALGDPKWNKRLLLRTSNKVYNKSLVAMFIAEEGEEKAEQLVKSWVDNLAADPLAKDSQVMDAIVDGQGDIGIVNTYYFGHLMRENPNLKLALFWPNQESTGVHVNVSGGGVLRSAKHRKEAVKFLEWLSSEKAQNLYADVVLEYPVNPRVQASKEVAAWGDFNQNKLNLSKAGELQTTATRLMERVGYN